MLRTDYTCHSCGHEFYRVTQRGKNLLWRECPKCKTLSRANPVLLPNLLLDGTDPNSSEWHRWWRKRKEKMKQEKRLTE